MYISDIFLKDSKINTKVDILVFFYKYSCKQFEVCVKIKRQKCKLQLLVT